MRCNPSKLRRDSGFTLVEIIVVSAILLGVITIMFNIYNSGYDLWEVSKDKADLQAQSRIALDRITQELRNTTRTSTQNPSPNISIPSIPNNKDIIFYLPEYDADGNVVTDSNGEIDWETDNAIKYEYVPGLKRVRRLEKGVQTILVQNVQDVRFVDIDIDPLLNVNELKIILSLEKTTAKGRSISFTSQAIIALRN